MDRFLALLFQDPILIITALVFLATVAILVWALNAWKNTTDFPEEFNVEEEQPVQDEEPSANAGLLEARLLEMSRQLAEISVRLVEMEKNAVERKAFEQQAPSTITAGASSLSSIELERIIKRLESKIEALALEKSQLPSDSITRIEARLEGIHRLLILLTEGDGSTTNK